MNDKLPIQSSNRQSRAELLKTVGVAVLVLGFIAASILYWTGERSLQAISHDSETPELERSWKDGTLSPEDLKGSSRTIEMNLREGRCPVSELDASMGRVEAASIAGRDHRNDCNTHCHVLLPHRQAFAAEANLRHRNECT